MEKAEVLPRLDSLTGLRFIAALAVLMYHAQFIGVSGTVTNPGFEGVTFFFLLSGFVLAWSHRPGTLNFYKRRIARIYPIYLVAILCGILCNIINHVAQTPLMVLRDLSLTQAWFIWVPKLGLVWAPIRINTIDGPIWTLSVEAFFYLTFPIWIYILTRISRRQRQIAAIVIAAIPIVGWVLSIHYQTFSAASQTYSYWGAPFRLTEFLLGMIAAFEVKDGLRIPMFPAFILLAGSSYYLWTGTLDRNPYFFLMPQSPVIVPFTVIICAFASADLRGKFTLFNSKPLVVLGTWSYALYLFHDMVLTYFQEWASHLPEWVIKPPWPFECLFIVVVIGLSAAIYKYVEYPAERWIRRLQLFGPADDSSSPSVPRDMGREPADASN
jgi:peptidoglycan/LPS O-acetylase OafA/YrhL